MKQNFFHIIFVCLHRYMYTSEEISYYDTEQIVITPYRVGMCIEKERKTRK